MVWTRKSLTETSDWFNQKPLAPSDESLRLPLALREFLNLAEEEYSVVLKKRPLVVNNGYIYFRPYWDYFLQVIVQPKIYFVLWRLVRETKKAKQEWRQEVKKFQEGLKQAKKQDLSKLSNKELLEHVKETIKFDAYWLFKLGAGIHTLYHYLSEILLKFLYHFLVEDPYPQNYHELLIGYPSKLKEADLAFWQVVKGSLTLDGYLEEYGLRATDATLAILTIGEDKTKLQKQIEIFRKGKIPDLEKRQREVLKRRKAREKYVADNFRFYIPFGKWLFDRVLAVARDYISVRETRRFYYTMPTFLIRKSLLELGRRFKFLEKPEDVFFLTKDDLEKAVLDPKGIKVKPIQTEITKRREQWEKWSKQTPPMEIK